MTTTAEGPFRRPRYTPDMFAALTDAPVLGQSLGGGWATVTFDGDLDAQTIAAIRELMASRDDADLARRAAIRAAREGGATNLAQILAADRLDEPLPEPIYPA